MKRYVRAQNSNKLHHRRQSSLLTILIKEPKFYINSWSKLQVQYVTLPLSSKISCAAIIAVSYSLVDYEFIMV